jgi:uncharacterized protein (DUF2236 family)
VLLARSSNEAILAVSAKPSSITEIDLERGFDVVRSKAAGPVDGVFGPGSTIWQVDREALVFLGAGRALLLQLAHPWVATAIAEHSNALSDPIGRFHRTFEIVFTLVFGSLEQALATSRRLHRRHAALSGYLPETFGPYAKGSPYLANEVSALMWVHATLVETALAAHDLVLEPLGTEPRARYYADCQLLGVLFGIPLGAQPPDWPAFARYFEAMVVSEELTVGPAAREIGTRVLAGAGRVPIPRWYRNVTAHLMPERLRKSYGLPFGEEERRSALRALRLIRRVYPVLPTRLRYVAPYHEALGRLCGRSRPDLMTRSLNRLWIGRECMDD